MAQQEEQLQPSKTLISSEGFIELGAPAIPAEPVAEEALDEKAGTRVSSPGRDAVRRFRKNWAAVLSLGVVVALVIMAIFAPFMHTTNPLTQDYTQLNFGPSPQHWFGTDGTGEDIYSRVIYGIRVPIMVGIIGTGITVFLGTIIGVIAGYFGSWTDTILSRFTDLIFAFPAFLLALLVVSLYGDALNPIFGSSGRVYLLIVVFALVSWPALTRFVRSLTLGLREQQFVEASRTSGSSSWKIIRRHLLPNMYGLILVQAALIAVGIIYTEATLSIFGLGVAPPAPDLGQMLYDGASQLNSGVQPGIYCLIIFPAIFFAVMLLAFTFVGDGVRDAVDPRMNS